MSTTEGGEINGVDAVRMFDAWFQRRKIKSWKAIELDSVTKDHLSSEQQKESGVAAIEVFMCTLHT